MFTSERPLLIILGGFAGAGKTTLSRRLSADLGLPRLGSDDLIRIVNQSRAHLDGTFDIGWVAYDVFFGLAEEHIRTGLSVILDSNMGDGWRWQRLDAIRERHRKILTVPIILRLPIETCIERMRGRHAGDPANECAPEVIMGEPRHVRKYAFVENLDRPDVHFVDANRPQETVYEEVKRHILTCADHGRVMDRQQGGPS